MFDYKETESAARSRRLELQSVEVSRADELERALSAVTNQRAQALIVPEGNPVEVTKRDQIVSFAQRSRLPPIFPWSSRPNSSW